MAVTIDWPSQIIHVPRADLLLVQSVPTEIRQMNLDNFRLALKSLEDDEEGIPWPTTHNHSSPVTVGGVTLARVVEIINGYTVTFEDGQYAVNLVGANSNVGDVVNVNQVSVRSANSAGLTYSKEVEDQSFNDARVYINTITGNPGILFPRGTPGDPVNNWHDALDIITTRDLPKRIFLRGQLVLDSDDVLDDFDIEGSSAELAQIDFGDASTDSLVVSACGMSGDTNGPMVADTASSFSNINSFEGSMIDCGIKDVITFGGAGPHAFINCYSLVAGTATPVLDCASYPNFDLSVRNYSGGLELRNLVSGNITVDLNSGHVKLAASCTGGTIVIRGVGKLTDNSAGSTIEKSGLAQEAVWLSDLALTVPKIQQMAIEAGIDFQSAVKVLLAVAAGKSSVVGSTVKFRDQADSVDRVAATMSGSERANITLNTN